MLLQVIFQHLNPYRTHMSMKCIQVFILEMILSEFLSKMVVSSADFLTGLYPIAVNTLLCVSFSQVSEDT